jgi:hypothetical protein
MLSSYQIFHKLPASSSEEILRYMRDDERDVYKSALATLAAGRKLRAVFIQKRPLDKQLAWMTQSLSMKSGDSIAEQLLQVWLLKAKKDMLVSFLDEVGVEHDGDGAVDDLPDKFDDGKLKSAVDKILSEHPADAVKIYLHIFQAQQPEGWDELGKILAEDERLAFSE